MSYKDWNSFSKNSVNREKSGLSIGVVGIQQKRNNRHYYMVTKKYQVGIYTSFG
ncbi:hypothetical protein SDC9_74031 [bioreactor metagenome]|uniref:Uncharacterized protein n=1 Tax=bioreactor metagenome TaxID=1076179 RepID=A0A644YGR7_9ZZZZ